MDEHPPAPSWSLPLAQRGDADALNNPPAADLDEVDLRDYWRVIKSRLSMIVICGIGTAVVAALIMGTKAPLYTAEATLLLERQAPQVLHIQGVLSESAGSDRDEYDFYKT